MQSYLGGVGTLVADLTITSADVVVVLRGDFQAVSAPGLSSTTAPATSAKPTTTSAGAKATTAPKPPGC